MWSGQKFQDIVDGDRTPDISTESDSELNLKMSKNFRDLGKFHLDSDEDEMRINYIRELKEQDENNNNVSSSESSYNLMGNIHYAHLELDDVQLSNENKSQHTDDFFPIVHGVAEERPRSSEFEKSSYLIDSVSEISEVISSSKKKFKKSREVVHASSTEKLSEISIAQSLDKDYSSYNLNSSCTKSFSRSSKKKYKEKDFLESTHSEQTSEKTKSSNSRKSLSKSSCIKKSKSDLPQIDKSKTEHSNTQDSNVTFYSSESSFSRSKSSSKNTKNLVHNERHIEEKKKTKNVKTQTDYKPDDKTRDVLDYLYSWQLPKPSNITAQVIDADTIDLYTNLNPAVLAANDMLKYHLHLIRKHLEDSRRLYESYANESTNTNYIYTSVEDTMNFIEKHRPNVISYKEALRQVKKSSALK